MVGSAGCIPLTSLISSPDHVQLVEVNPDQLRLIRLKAAAFKELDYSECMSFLGCFQKPKFHRERIGIYNKLSKHLNSADKAHWEHELDKVAKGIVHQGKFENYLRFFGAILLPLCISKSVIHKFLNAPNLSEQVSIYREKIDNKRYQFFFKLFFGKLIMKKIGRHPKLLEHVKLNTGNVFYERVKRGWTEVPVRENYFFRYILNGYFDPAMALPEWMKARTFDSIKKNVQKLSYLQCSMSEFLTQTQNASWDVIYLSNITETMSDETADALFELCRRALKPGGRMIVWNNLLERQPKQGFRIMEASEGLWKNRLDSFYGFAGIYERQD